MCSNCHCHQIRSCCEPDEEEENCNCNCTPVRRKYPDCSPCRRLPDFKSMNFSAPTLQRRSSSSTASGKSKGSIAAQVAAQAAAQAHIKKSSKMRSKEKNIKSNQSCYSVCITESPCTNGTCPAKNDTSGSQERSKKSTSSSKHLKNKQNYQNQDANGNGKKPMEVINEEQEDTEDENSYFENEQNKKIQDSCADFLGIVHDTVLETVQKSVETMLRDYFMHTMEKIECLCSQMVRNDCLISKMYLDIMDKMSQQNDRNQRQFKCLCQFLIESKNSQKRRGSDSSFEFSPEVSRRPKTCSSRKGEGCSCHKHGKNRQDSRKIDASMNTSYNNSEFGNLENLSNEQIHSSPRYSEIRSSVRNADILKEPRTSEEMLAARSPTKNSEMIIAELRRASNNGQVDPDVGISRSYTGK